jgi:hypothetical protein
MGLVVRHPAVAMRSGRCLVLAVMEEDERSRDVRSVLPRCRLRAQGLLAFGRPLLPIPRLQLAVQADQALVQGLPFRLEVGARRSSAWR